MKNTTAILYNGGAYGTYLDWILNTMTSDRPPVAPFQTHGTSHGWKGHQKPDIDAWRLYAQTLDEFAFVRCHPKTDQKHSLKNNIDEILNDCKQAILIYPSREHELLCINNFITKPWPTDDVFDGPLRSIDRQTLYNNWPVVEGVDPKDIPRWITREFLSFYLVPAWRDQVEWYFPDKWKHPRCLVIYTREIFYDIETVLNKIKKFVGLQFTKNIDILKNYHKQMLAMQTWINADQQVEKIVHSLIVPEAESIEWTALSLANESYIQWKLRGLGYLLRCHGVDQLPTNTAVLKQLIYRNEKYADQS